MARCDFPVVGVVVVPVLIDGLSVHREEHVALLRCPPRAAGLSAWTSRDINAAGQCRHSARGSGETAGRAWTTR